MPVGITTFTFQSSQPHGGGGVADNTVDQCLDKSIEPFNVWLSLGLNRLADTVKFLLNTQVGEGGDTQFRGDICAYLVTIDLWAVSQ